MPDLNKQFFGKTKSARGMACRAHGVFEQIKNKYVDRLLKIYNNGKSIIMAKDLLKDF